MGLFGGSSSKSRSEATDMRTVADAQARAVVGNRNTRIHEGGSRSATGNNSQYRESGSVDLSRGGKLVESGGFDLSGRGNRANFGIDLSGRGAKYIAPGAADFSGMAAGTTASITYDNHVSTDGGAVDKALNFASQALASFLNKEKTPTVDAGATVGAQLTDFGAQLSAQMAAQNQQVASALGGFGDSISAALGNIWQNAQQANSGLGESISNAISGAMQNAAGTVAAAQPIPTQAGDAGKKDAAPAWYKNPLILLGLGVGAYFVIKGRK